MRTPDIVLRKFKWSIAGTLLGLAPVVFLGCVHTPPPATEVGDPLPGLTKAQLNDF